MREGAGWAADAPVRWGVFVLVVALVVTLPGLARGQQGGEPLPTMVFLARADDPVDALAAGGLAGTLGASVLLTAPDRLSPPAAAVLEAQRPDLVVLVGGTAALSEAVEADVVALGLVVRRVAAGERTATAAEVAAFAEELGAGRPVVTGRPVTDAVVPGLNAARLEGYSAEDLMDAVGVVPGAPRLDPDESETDVFVHADHGSAAANGQALLAAIAGITGAGPDRPFVVRLAPGVYDVGVETVQLKSHVSLVGAGQQATRITASGGAVIGTADGVEVRDLAASLSTTEFDGFGILTVADTGVAVRDVTVTVTGATQSQGVVVTEDSTVVLERVHVSVSGGGSVNFGVQARLLDPQVTIRDSVITASGVNARAVVASEVSTVHLEGSVVSGPTAAFHVTDLATLRVAATRASGPPLVFGTNATLACHSVYAFDFTDYTCP